MRIKIPIISILFFIIIFINEDTFFFSVNSNYNYIIVKYVTYCLLIAFLLLRNYKGYDQKIYVLLLLIGLILFSALFNLDFSGGFIYQIIIIILSFLIVKEIQFDDFILLFCKWIYYLTILSLIIYVVAILFPKILNLFPVVTNIAGTKYYNLFVSMVFVGDGFTPLRNTSIFREPGIFIIYLNIALAFALFVKFNLKYCLVYLVGILSTMSTAGIIICSGLIFLYIFFDQITKVNLKKFILLSLIVVAILYVALNKEIFVQVFDKLKSTSGNYYSTVARVASLYIPMIIFVHNPVFGGGIESFSTDFYQYSSTIFSHGLETGSTATNTYMNIFGTYGIIYGLIFIFALYYFVKFVSLKRSIAFTTCLFLLFFAMFSNEDMRYSLIFNILFFYSFSSKEALLKKVNSRI